MKCCNGPEGNKVFLIPAVMCKLAKMEGYNKKRGGWLLNLEYYLTTLVNSDYTSSEPEMESWLS